MHLPQPPIIGERCVLRAYRDDDVAALPAIAGDLEVARWMAATFPHPYTTQDAQAWVARASNESPLDNFAIELDGALAGGVGFRPHAGERRGVAEFGYWLGRAFWGRGIATEVARLCSAYAFGERRVRRLEAHVFAPNAASARVLEKCGFVREAMMRDALTGRDGYVVDAWLYARLASA
jgi:ribosomal-protein-alanine N-acetyltransferase